MPDNEGLQMVGQARAISSRRSQCVIGPVDLAAIYAFEAIRAAEPTKVPLHPG
jgi:hypothetical protein